MQSIRAGYANDVLHLTFPVAEAAQRRRIEVQSTDTQQSIEMSGGQERTVPGAHS